MKYYLKEISEKELEDFLLNPFERTAYLEDTLIQKYPRDPYVDDFFFSNLSATNFQKIGHIIYKKNEVILDKIYALRTDIVSKKPFITICDLKDRLKEELKLKVKEIKKSRLVEIKSSEKYKSHYSYYKRNSFDSLVFSTLGTTHSELFIKNKTNDEINDYVSKITSDKFVESEIGALDLVSPFVNQLLQSSNFIISEILINELKKEAEEYVAAGKFSKRELTLIDYLEKTKASGALSFEVESFEGNQMICKNIVDYEGRVISVDGMMLMMDIEEIKTVKYLSKIIYTKKVL